MKDFFISDIKNNISSLYIEKRYGYYKKEIRLLKKRGKKGGMYSNSLNIINIKIFL